MNGLLQQQFRRGSFSVLLLLVAGCHPQSSPKVDAKAFAQGAPELQQSWASAQTADHADNYAAALAKYYALLRQPLTPDQRQAVDAASTALNQRLTKALQAGESGAKAALEQIRANPPNRRN